MFKSIIIVFFTAIITALILVFLVFPIMAKSLIIKNEKLAMEVKDLQVQLRNANGELNQLKVKIDELSKRNDALEDIGKERILNIISMYQVGT